MKKYLTNDEIYAAFPAQDRPEGRTRNGSMYFSGRKAWSYGEHFMMAHIMREKVMLVTKRDSSATTNKHIRAVHVEAERQGYRVFVVAKVRPLNIYDHAANLQDLWDRMKEREGERDRARTKWMIDMWARVADELYRDYCDYARASGHTFILRDRSA